MEGQVHGGGAPLGTPRTPLALVVATGPPCGVGVAQRGGGGVVESAGALQHRLVGGVDGHAAQASHSVVATPRLPQDPLHRFLLLLMIRYFLTQGVHA